MTTCCDTINTVDYFAAHGANTFKDALKDAIVAKKTLLVGASLSGQTPVDTSDTAYLASGLGNDDIVSIRGCGPDTTVAFAAGAQDSAFAIIGKEGTASHSARFTYSASGTTNYSDYYYSSELTADAYPNTYTLKLKDVTPFSVGGLIRLRSRRLVEGENRASATHGETNRVVAIAQDSGVGVVTGTITVELPLRDAYSYRDKTWKFTVASATAKTITLNATGLVNPGYADQASVNAADLIARFVRGCRVYCGSGVDDFRYADSYDPATRTINFDNGTSRNNNDWPALTAGSDVYIDAQTFATAAASPLVEIADIGFLPAASGAQNTGLYIRNAHGVRLRNVSSNGWAAGKTIETSLQVLVDDGDDRQAGARNNSPVSFKSCNEAEWRNSRAYNFWQPGDDGNGAYYGHAYRYVNVRLVSGYGTTDGPWVDGAITDETQLPYAMTTHGAVLDIVYDGCVGDNMLFPIQQRGVRETYRDCQLYYPGHWYGVALAGGYSIRIENCSFTDRYYLETWPRPASEPTTYPFLIVRAPFWWGDIFIDGLRGDIRGSLVTIAPEAASTTPLKVRGRISMRNLAGLNIRQATGDVQLVTSTAGPYLGNFSQGGSQAGYVVENGIDIQLDPGDVTLIGSGKLIVDPRMVMSRRVGSGNAAAPALAVGEAATGFYGTVGSLRVSVGGRNVAAFLSNGLTAHQTANVPQANYVRASAWLSASGVTTSGWNGVCWSPELGKFAGVSSGSPHVNFSADGATWTTSGITPPANSWRAICWSPQLARFCAVGSSGNRVMMWGADNVVTSYATGSSALYGVCWSPELNLFCAVAQNGTGNRVLTVAVDAAGTVTWANRTSAADNTWTSVCWAAEIGLFCAVASTGTGNRVMTSPDGITWTSRTSAADNDWNAVCWSPELGLLCAVASTGTGNRVMTSPDGVTWTTRTSAVDNGWTSVCWSPELGLFCAAANAGAGTGDRVMMSADGITWATGSATGLDNSYTGVAWSPQLGLFAALATSGSNGKVMTSKSAFTYPYR